MQRSVFSCAALLASACISGGLNQGVVRPHSTVIGYALARPDNQASCMYYRGFMKVIDSYGLDLYRIDRSQDDRLTLTVGGNGSHPIELGWYEYRPDHWLLLEVRKDHVKTRYIDIDIDAS